MDRIGEEFNDELTQINANVAFTCVEILLHLLSRPIVVGVCVRSCRSTV